VTDSWQILIGIILGVGVILYGIFDIRRVRAENHIRRERSNVTLDTFRLEFLDSTYDKRAIELAYLDLKPLARFPLRRADSFEWLQIDFEDFQDSFESRWDEINLSDPEFSDYKKCLPIKSVEDYVRFLSEAYKAKDAEKAQAKPPL